LVGFGDIGRNTAKRLVASELKVIAYDPFFKPFAGLEAVESAAWPDRLFEADFLVLTCALTKENRHMVNASAFASARTGLRVVNVARGPLMDEAALVEALDSCKVHSAALDVFEEEPLMPNSQLRRFGNRCVFGSHNGSNTIDAVRRTSDNAIKLLFDMLKIGDATNGNP
jgi:D-3-phosphoglycerate dehydrogenase